MYGIVAGETKFNSGRSTRMQIRITLSPRGDRIHLKPGGWRPGIADECKSIQGWSWAETKKCWTYPLSMVTLRRMREVFEDELDVSGELWDWAKSERRKEKRLKSLSSQSDALLRRVPEISPVLSAAMADRTYQRVGARFGAVAGSFLLADEPGLGKTASSLAALMESGLWHGDILVVAPKTSLSSVWGRQISMWSDGKADVYVIPDGAARRKKTIGEFMDGKGAVRFLVINPAMLRREYGHWCKMCDLWYEDVKKKGSKLHWPTEHHMQDHKLRRAIKSEEWPEILDHEWTAVIIDESHELFAAYTPSNITLATAGALDLRSQARYALTGTPLRGQEKRIWGTLNWLAPQQFKGYWGFIAEYFEVAQGFFGQEVLGVDPSRKEALYALFDRYVLRRTRHEVRGDLPDGQRFDVMVEMSPKHRKQYEEFERLGETELAQGTVSGQGMLSELTRLKQLAYGLWVSKNGHLVPQGESPKFDWLLEWLRARGVTGTKVNDWLPEQDVGYKYVIASQSTEILDAMERDFAAKKIKTMKITGAVSGKRRTEYQNTFQSRDTEYRIMLIQTKTGGVSIELDAWCDEMVIIDETFIADDQKQLEGRIDNRSGRVSPRSFWYVRTADTIDQKIAESNWSQQDLQHKLLDGRRGVEFALHLLKGA